MKRLLCLLAAVLGLAGPASAQMAGGTAGLTVGNVGAHAAQVRTAIGAMSCPGTGSCAPRNTFLAALQAVAPSVNGVAVSNVALDLETSLIIGSPAELEFGSGQVSSGGALASFIQGRYGITGPTMAAVFTAAGASVNNNGTIAQFALPTLAQMLGLGVAPTANPTFTGTVTAALLSVNGIGTGSLTAGGVTIGGGFLGLNTSGAGTDNNKWTFFNTAGQVGLQAYGDAGNGGNLAWTCSRNATVVSGCVVQAPLTATAGFGFNPALNYSAVSYGMRQMERNIQYLYWDGGTGNDSGMLRIRPSSGNGDATNGIVTNTKPGSFWQMASVLNAMYWDFKANPTEDRKTKIKNEWTYIQSVFTQTQLSTSAGLGVTYNTEDDGTWVALSLMMIHEVTGDPAPLYDLGELIPSLAQVFADPNQTIANGLRNSYGTSPGGVTFNNGKYGMLYCKASDTVCANNYGYTSTSYEAGLAIAAMYYFDKTANGYYRTFASDDYNWIKAYLSTPAPTDSTRKAQYLIETALDLDPTAHQEGYGNWGTHTSGSNTEYLHPQLAYYGKPIRGVDSTYINGAFFEGWLGALLYQDGGNSSYLTDIANIVSGITSAQGYKRTFNGLSTFCNCRDPWSDGFAAPGFVYNALSLAGSDPTGSAHQMFLNTALNIFSTTNVNVNNYTADWSGPEAFNGGPATWQAAYNASVGTQAGYQQIMTDANTDTMARAGAMIAEQMNRR